VHYIHDLQGHIIAEADGATGATLREYVWMAANDNTPTDLPLATVDDVTTTPVFLMVHSDHLGRPLRMTDAARATVWQASYKPWGEVQTISGTKALNLRFPGQYFQIETNLAYNWHRHYDMVTGRYTQPDPLGFVDGPSVYAYAGNSPFMMTDRDGRELSGGARPTKCKGVWWWVGLKSHVAFYSAVAGSSNASGGFSFNNGFEGLFTGRPDVYQPNSGQVWELKPTTAGSGSGYSAARVQINGYVNSTKGRLLSPVPPVRQGNWATLFGERPSVSSGGFRFYPDNPSGSSGLVFYDCPPEPQSCPANDLGGIVLPKF
jgi:RHS repeat-associated protein